MSDPLNPQQFERRPGVFQGEPGEPDPDTYLKDDDWLQDHKRFVARRNEGKPFIDRDMQQAKAQAKEQAQQEEQPYREGAQRAQNLVKGLRGLNRAAGRAGMRPRRKIW